MNRGFGLQFVRPIGVMALIGVVVGAIIIGLGLLLLEIHPEVIGADLVSEFIRPDLVVALGAALAVLIVGAWLARPKAEPGPLDEPVAIGDRPFNAPVLPPIDEAARRGPVGTVADIAEGYTIYAQNGELARVVGLLPGEEEFGRRRRGFIYASGVYGANDEMWIPVEAVLAVYPETRSVFLAAKGDEIESFGWNLPPASFRRTPPVAAEVPRSF